MRHHFFFVIIILLLSLPAIKNLFKPGAYTSHDLTHHIVRTIHMDKILTQGQFPPRWIDELNYGYGYPLFLFNYPLPSMMAVGIHRLGFDYIWSVKLTFALSMILSAVFAYILFAYLWRNRWAGFVGSLFYLYAPIRFLNVYVSATFGNAVAFMFVPLVFYALLKAYRHQANHFTHLAGGLSLAGLLLSHNIMALMFLPIIGLFFLLFADRHTLLAILLGLGLSSWFWIPASFEKNLIRYDASLPEFYKTHFPALKQLIRSPWGYGFSHPGTELDAMSFQVGLAHLLVVGLSLVLVIKRPEKLTVFFLIIFFISIFLMLQISDPLWRTIPFLPYLQMPWRLLAVSIFAASILAGFIVTQIRPTWLTSLILAIAVIIANRNHWRINQVLPVTDQDYLTINNTTTMASEHLPRGSDKFDDFPPATTKLSFLEGRGEISYISNAANQVIAQIKVDSPVKLQFNQIYFPGWNYQLNGQPLVTTYSPSRPLPQFTLGSGTYQFAARFSRTPIRLVADIISLAALPVYYVITHQAFRRFSHLQRSRKPTQLP